MTRGSLVLREWKKTAKIDIQVTPRVGIRHCADWPLRFVIPENLAVSR